MSLARICAALAVAGLVTASLGCGSSASAPYAPARAAPPQQAELGWVERFPATGPALEFEVRAFAVTPGGWEADVALRNTTDVTWTVAATTDRVFGVMLFPNGDHAELERRSTANDLPGVRRARSFRPQPPLVLEPGKQWSGRISAPGALAANRWLRVTFGQLTAVGSPPKGLPSQVVWITDNAYRLKA